MRKDRLGAIFGKGKVNIAEIDFVGGKAEVEYTNEEGEFSTASVPYKDVKHIIGKYLYLNGLPDMEKDIEEEEALYNPVEPDHLQKIMKQGKVRPSAVFGKGKRKLSSIDLADLGRCLSYKLGIYILGIGYSDGKVAIEYVDENQEGGFSTFSIPHQNEKSLIAEYREMRRLINEITILTSKNNFGSSGLQTMPMKTMIELQERLQASDSSALSYMMACADKIRPMRDKEIYSSLEVADLVEIKARIENQIELVGWERGRVADSAVVIPKIIETDSDELSEVEKDIFYHSTVPTFEKVTRWGEEFFYDYVVPVIPYISERATDSALEMIHSKAVESFQPISTESLIIDEISERDGTFVIKAMEFISSELLVPDVFSRVQSDEVDRMLRTVGTDGVLPDDSYIDIEELRRKCEEEEENGLFRLSESF